MKSALAAINTVCDTRSRILFQHQVWSPDFERVRSCLRELVSQIGDEESVVLSESFENLRKEWWRLRYAPAELNGEFSRACEKLLGGPSRLGRLYGEDVGQIHEKLQEAALILESRESAARHELGKELARLAGSGTDFRVFCHRKEKSLFETLVQDGEVLLQNRFIHSLSEYAAAESFDSLVMFGPSRTRGWGRTPDAFVTAPKFFNRIHFVWGEASDDEEFGFDPVASMKSIFLGNSDSQNGWQVNKIMHGDHIIDEGRSGSLTDELEQFERKSRAQYADSISAVLFAVGYREAIAFAPGSHVWLFDPSYEDESAIFSMPAEDVSLSSQGRLFLIDLGEIGEVDLGGPEVKNENLAHIWKSALARELNERPERLIRRLRESRIGVGHLQSALQRWVQPSSSVIRAPKLFEDFKRLIRALSNETPGSSTERLFDSNFVNEAWKEISSSRGAAVQYGAEEHHLIEEEKINILNSRLSEERDVWASGDSYDFLIPPESGIPGSIRFREIGQIDVDVEVPRSETRMLANISRFTEWLS